MMPPSAAARLRTLFPCTLPLSRSLGVVLKLITPADNCRGLFAFGSTTLIISLFNVHARHVAVPNVIVGMALFNGGPAQFMAGMWGFAAGNAFAATGEF
jgi:succinate-acetate transporter protein